MAIYDTPVKTLTGEDASLHDYEGKVLLIVNVASKCGNTPQYAALEELYERFEPQGFAVLGFPCNQFGAQEPGTGEEIAEFCSTTYGVKFPMFEKIDVNGVHESPLYTELKKTATADGDGGEIKWNFEKFIVQRDGTVGGRFSPRTAPDDANVVGAIENALSA